MLLDLERSGANDHEGIELFRDGSMLKMDGYELPVLRICTGPGM
jgi:hypothetical protein